MKIVITEEQKNKLFVPRKIDERQEQFKQKLSEKTKEIISHFNISQIINHGRIDDYDEEILSSNINDGYHRVIIDNINYHGFPIKVDTISEELVLNWEEMLATYLNMIIPQPSDESISKSQPNIVGRMYRVEITPSKMYISFSYGIVEYTNKKGNETITL